MGNCVSIQLTLDSLITRCSDCAGTQVSYVWQLKDKLQDLKNSKDQLQASNEDLLRNLRNQEGPQTKRKEIVRVWLESAANKLTEADQLIQEAEQEIDEKLCLGGCCSTNCKSSYQTGKDVADKIDELNTLLNQRENDQFQTPVERVVGEPDHLRKLKKDLEAVETARKGLLGLKQEVNLRIKRKAGPEMKPKPQVEVWLSNVDSLIIEVDGVIGAKAQQIERWSAGDFSDDGFGVRVAESLERVNALKIEGGSFDEVVIRVPADPEYIRILEDDLDALESAKQELWASKLSIMKKVNNEELQPRMQRTAQVSVWISGVEATVKEVDALLKNRSQEVKKLRHGDFSKNYGEAVARKLTKVLELQKKGVFQQVTEIEPPEAVVQMDCGFIVGLETKLKEVWNCIMKEKVGIVGLYGMGGVGKTTLLVQINNQFLKTQYSFDFVIWVVVSKDLKLSKVQEEIGERIGISNDDWKKKNIDEKAKDISNVLRKKRFVLLLDDIWERVNLAKAGVPIPRQNGSKIVLTTRSEMVCSLMDAQPRIKVETLSDEQAWELFTEKVGEEVLSLDPAIPPIAAKVAKECDGLPLALITIGRAMTCNRTPEAWSIALKQLQQSVSDHSEGMMEKVFPRLKYSYDKLPDEKVQSCFTYCALFPEDYRIYKDDLIDYWICEKFEDQNNEKVNWDRAYGIIQTLIHACLLEEEGKYVKMHDVIRDMALWLSCKLEKTKYNFMVQAGKQLNKAPDVEKWPEGVRRTSLMQNSIRSLQEVPQCPNLLTLFLCHNPRLQQINGSFFQYMHELTILDLSNSRVQELPLGIAELGSLQYLNLSHTWIEQLPLELKRLRSLKYLNLEHNAFLAQFPKEVLASFLALEVLRMFRCGFFYDGSKEDNLLSDDGTAQIEALKLLRHLNALSITIRSAKALKLYFGIENLPSSTRALSLDGFTGSESLDLSPIENMEQLEILHVSASKEYKGEELREIVVKPIILREKRCFNKLREVTVEYCTRVSNLEWLILAPNLAILKVTACEKMEEIISAEVSNDLRPFPRLEILVLEGLPQLKSIYWSTISSASLRRIRVVDCPMLKKLPLKSASRERKVIIEAEEQWWKVLEWEDDATKAAFQSSFRKCLPRTKTFRPAHDHFYDIWKSLSS